MLNFKIKGDRNLAIDLGNNNTLLTDQNNAFLSQPSYIVLNKENRSVKAIGEEAFNMFEKTHGSLRAIKPLKGGVIADYENASKMVRAMVDKAYPSRSFFSGFDNIISGVPYSTTEVERRALRDILEQFNSSNTFLLFEPLAAAIGMGLNIREPDGKFIVDIGGGITEIVLISLSGVVTHQSIKVAGDTFDEDIQDYFRRNFNLSIGIKTAEQIKINVGAASAKISSQPFPVEIVGKDLMTGIPKTRIIDHAEVAEILDKSLSKIEQAIIETLEASPPELAGDIYNNGIHLTGGSSLLRGLKERLQTKVKIEVHQDQNALFSVTKGISETLKSPKRYSSVLVR